MDNTTEAQTFYKDLLAALDGMTSKRLIRHALEKDGQYCAVGALCMARKLDVTDVNFRRAGIVAQAEALNVPIEIMLTVEVENDEGYKLYAAEGEETTQERWRRMHAWTKRQITSNE